MNDQLMLVPITLAAFKTLVSDSVAEAMAANNAAKEPVKQPEDYLSRVEAAKYLKSSLQTLNEATKAGKISGYRFGARVLYKRAELDAVLAANSTSRYQVAGKKRGPKPKATLAATAAK